MKREEIVKEIVKDLENYDSHSLWSVVKFGNPKHALTQAAEKELDRRRGYHLDRSQI